VRRPPLTTAVAALAATLAEPSHDMEKTTMVILVIHGAGMNMRGKVQTDVFGTLTLPEYDVKIRAYAAALGMQVEIFHSNVEGEVINRLYAAHDDGIDGAIINPDGFTRGYPALVTAISRVRFPTIEVHISNPARRGTHSDIATASQGVIAGFGIIGYDLALRGLKAILAK
jgi:3-dehydroquinate dehydratase-2